MNTFQRSLSLVLSIAACFSVAVRLPSAWAQENRTTNTSPEEYERFVNESLSVLTEGTTEQMTERFTEGVIRRTKEHYGDGAIERIIDEKFRPFFEDLKHLDTSLTSVPTTDADGNRGMAFFRTFLTKDNRQKPFVIYVVREEGALKIGNLLINKLYREVIEPGREQP